MQAYNATNAFFLVIKLLNFYAHIFLPMAGTHWKCCFIIVFKQLKMSLTF